MSDLPSNVLQFRRDDTMTPEEHRRLRNYYFGSCGDGQGFWPKRHSWGPWQEHTKTRDRTCKWCGLVSDPQRLPKLKDRP